MALLHLFKEIKWLIQQQCVQVSRANCSQERTTLPQVRETPLRLRCTLQLAIWVREQPPTQQLMKLRIHQAQVTQRGGVTVTNANAPATSGTTAYWTPSASFTWSALTVTTAFDAVLIYNSTSSNKAVSVHNFGSQTVTAGTFTLTMPTNDATTGLLRIA